MAFPVALVAPVFYAIEGNIVALWGTYGMDPVQVLAGASMIAVPVTRILALSFNQWIDPRGPWTAPDWALFFSAVIHAGVQSRYVWLVGLAGSVFAAQVACLVMGFGVAWSIWPLQESYSLSVWAALGAMLIGVFLVQPKRPMPLAPVPGMSDNTKQDRTNEQA
jgi:drug/metabolite transporter (DMT)-like permease